MENTLYPQEAILNQRRVSDFNMHLGFIMFYAFTSS